MFTLLLLREAVLKQKIINKWLNTINIFLYIIVMALYSVFNLTFLTVIIVGLQIFFIFCTIGQIGRTNAKNINESEISLVDSTFHLYNSEIPDYYEHYNAYLSSFNVKKDKEVEIYYDAIDCYELLTQKYPETIVIDENSIEGVPYSPYFYKNCEFFENFI